MDWSALFAFDVSPLELIVRGSVVYWFLFLVFRFVMRRDFGVVSTADVLLVVLVADASQNAMIGSATSVSEGLVLVSTLFGWNWLLDRLSFHVPSIARVLDPPPLPLIRGGRVLRHNLRRENITMDELKSHLREAGIESPDQVRAAYMESDGQFSVIREDAKETPQHRRRTPGI